LQKCESGLNTPYGLSRASVASLGDRRADRRSCRLSFESRRELNNLTMLSIKVGAVRGKLSFQTKSPRNLYHD
jgi:hypothetical protein